MLSIIDACHFFWELTFGANFLSALLLHGTTLGSVGFEALFSLLAQHH
jgi:hypothetical protein